MLLVFVQNASLCFSPKTGSEVVSRRASRESSRLRASRESCLTEINFFSIHTESLATSSRVFCD